MTVDSGARLAGDGARLSLTITGRPYDSNWLVVRIDVEQAGERWTMVDPGLMAREAERIVAWFRSIAEDQPVGQRSSPSSSPSSPSSFTIEGEAFSSDLARQLERLPQRQSN